MTWAMLVPRKRTGVALVTLRCVDEPAIEALAREIAEAR